MFQSFYQSEEEDTPDNILTSMNSNKQKQKINPLFDKIKSVNDKINDLLKIVDSDDFKNLNDDIKEEKELKDQIIKELENSKKDLESLKSSQENNIKSNIEHSDRIKKERYETQKNNFNYNYNVYKKLKNDNSIIPEPFIYPYKIYDIIESLNLDDEDKLDKFIELYNLNYDNKRDIKKDMFNIFLDENRFYNI